MPAPLYLLDTNILLHLIRGKATGATIDATYQLQKHTYTPLICIVTHGEIWTLARENGWGPAKRHALEVMLNNLVTVDIHSDAVIEAYVEIEYVSRRVPGGAMVMGKNDLWIAAVAKVTGATLLTCDTDFDHLHPSQITRIYIDPRCAPSPTPPTAPPGSSP
jgi:tRNA(fMet)-specific endonuclease VapC